MGRKGRKRDYGPYVERTEGKVVVTRRGYVAIIVVVLLLLFGIGSKVAELLTPDRDGGVERAYREMMEGIEMELQGFGSRDDSAGVADYLREEVDTTGVTTPQTDE